MLLQQDWVSKLEITDQAILLQVIRAPDGLSAIRNSTIRRAIRAYRAVVCNAGKLGRPLEIGEAGDQYMCAKMYSKPNWMKDIENFITRELECMPYHWIKHFRSAVRIVAFNHPAKEVRQFWIKIMQII